MTRSSIDKRFRKQKIIPSFAVGEGSSQTKMEHFEKRKLKTLTLAQRVEVIKRFESGMKVMEISKMYEIPQSTVSTIIRRKEKWLKKKELNENLQSKRSKPLLNDQLEESMKIFVRQARENHIPLSGSIIREKACQYAASLGVQNFAGSNGWLVKFLKRQNISYKKLCGESASVDTAVTDNWKENELPKIIEDFEPHNIFNADETGLFYKCLPDKTFALQSESCHGGKYSKQRLTVMCATNMDGSEKLPLFVIGKSKNPRCFKNIKSLPVIYRGNKKAWMTSVLFEEWLMQLDEKFIGEGRKVLLLVDNCPSHPKSVQEKLRAIKLSFFPPNATSVLQPLDLGIIRTLKHYYRYALVKRRLDHMDKGLVVGIIVFCVNLTYHGFFFSITDIAGGYCSRCH